MDFLIINGKVVSKAEANLTKFLWDGPFIVSQKVWFGYGGIPMFQENIESIECQLATFNLALPSLFKNKRELFRLSKRMLNKNKFYRSGFIRFQFFISSGKINSVITSTAFTNFDFPFAKKGMLVNFSDYTKNSASLLGKFKCHNQFLWNSVQAQLSGSIYKGSIILNEKALVCEANSANIFMIKEKVLYTPLLETGCYEDVLRTVVLELAKKLKIEIIESSDISRKQLMGMDEVFFVSEELGIQWILGIEDKRYIHHYADDFHEQINTYLESRVD